MNMPKIKLGMLPTIRELFSFDDAIRCKEKIYEALKAFDCEVVDIEDCAPNGVLSFNMHREVYAVIEKFKKAGVDAIFAPHCSFGAEDQTAQICRALNVPVLLYGPRDEGPDADGMRLRDSQCGLFATGKVLRRHDVPFSYMTNCAIESELFNATVDKFLRVAAVVKVARNIRVLQIGPRPNEFLSVMINESELLERFNVRVFPIPLPELEEKVLKRAKEDDEAMQKACAYFRGNFKGQGGSDEEVIRKFAALKVTILDYAEEFNCNCAAIMCWDAFSVPLGIVPCAVNAMLSEEGFPVSCETDICASISALMLQAATGNTLPHFLADVTIRHPEDDNTELLWHCGPFPKAFAENPDDCLIRNSWTGAPSCGNCYWECKKGPVTVCRFDGDHGEYSLFIGEGESVKGPKSMGTYVWFKVDDWAKWEHKLVQGPYIHHVAGTYQHVADVLYEACRYIPGLKPDPASPSAEELEKSWRG